jgi:hypothetical protein
MRTRLPRNNMGKDDRSGATGEFSGQQSLSLARVVAALPALSGLGSRGRVVHLCGSFAFLNPRKGRLKCDKGFLVVL